MNKQVSAYFVYDDIISLKIIETCIFLSCRAVDKDVEEYTLNF